jgi:DNA polymerase-3 subunit delta'
LNIFAILKFADIHSHQAIKEGFISSIKQGRIAHAQMFIGREGNGALGLAVAYAQFASCLDRREDDSCGVCSSCLKYQNLVHPDLHFSFPIYGADVNCDEFINEFRTALTADPLLTLNSWFTSLNAENKKPNIPIKECRNIIRKLALKPYESEFKVLIIWLPEYLGKEGNVLLKLLEEPPEKTLFLLVTENQESILSTIISRTQFTRIPSYSYEEINGYLVGRNIANADLARNAALMAEGNLSKAIQLAGEIENPQFDDFRQWLLDCYQGNVSKIISDMDAYTDKGKEGLKLFLNYGVHLLRSSLLVRHRPENNKLTEAELEFANKLSKFIHIGNISQIYDGFNKAIFEIDRNGSVKLILINLSLKLKNCLRMPEPYKTN